MLEVWDTSGLQELQWQLERERVAIMRRHEFAKAEQRPVVRKNAWSDLKAVAKINQWVETIYKDPRRTW